MSAGQSPRMLTVQLISPGEFELRIDDHSEQGLDGSPRQVASVRLLIKKNSFCVEDIAINDDATFEERRGIERAAWMLYHEQHDRLLPDLET